MNIHARPSFPARGSSVKVSLRSLGVPPEHPCHDPNRPSWLPYWFDTWDEEACRFGFFPGAGKEPLKTQPLPPPPPAPPGAPQTREEMTNGKWTPEDAQKRGWENTMAEWKDFFDNKAGIPPKDPKDSPFSISPWMILGGVGGVILLILIARR